MRPPHRSFNLPTPTTPQGPKPSLPGPLDNTAAALSTSTKKSPTKQPDLPVNAEQAKPVEQTKPVEVAKPVEQANPAEQANPVELASPVEQVKPVEPDGLEQAKQVEPANIPEQDKPVEPAIMEETIQVDQDKPVDASSTGEQEVVSSGADSQQVTAVPSVGETGEEEGVEGGEVMEEREGGGREVGAGEEGRGKEGEMEGSQPIHKVCVLCVYVCVCACV